MLIVLITYYLGYIPIIYYLAYQLPPSGLPSLIRSNLHNIVDY
jgi:hypothetical protein